MLVEIGPYLLGATVSPVLLAMMVVVLAQKDKPLRQGLVLLAGGLLAAIPIGGVIFFLVHGQVRAARPSLTADAIHLAVGLVLLWLAARAWRKEPAKTTKRTGKKVRYGRDFAVGAALVASDFTSLIMFIPAGLVMEHAAPDERLAALALLIGALTMALWLPLVAVVVLGAKGQALLGAANRLMARRGSQITGTIVGLIAIYELYTGISGLL